jgi:uncharacterized membrane protein YkvA (DUF1232 family)
MHGARCPPILRKQLKIQVKEHVRRHRPWEIVTFVRHLPNFVRLFARLLRDARVPAYGKALLAAAAVYCVSPLDFIPDLLPMLGQVDDLALFVMACRTFISLAPKEVVQEHVKVLNLPGVVGKPSAVPGPE